MYDERGEHAIGYTARSFDEKCDDCGLHHPAEAECWFATPENKIIPMEYLKWRHSENLPRESTLFGWWHAAKSIEKKWKVIICESPGNVMRFHEAGFTHAVGMFGTRITDRQQIILEMSGAMEVVIATDNDEAGREGEEANARKLGSAFRLWFLHLPPEFNDWGEVPTEEVEELYKKCLKKQTRSRR